MASGSFGTFMSGIGATIKTTTFKVGTAMGLTAVAIGKSASRAYKNFKQKMSDKMAEAGSAMQNRAAEAEKKRQQKVATKKAEQAARDEVAAAARENAHKVSEDKITHGQEESQQRQGHIEKSGEKQRDRVEDSKKKKIKRGEQETAATIDEQGKTSKNRMKNADAEYAASETAADKVHTAEEQVEDQRSKQTIARTKNAGQEERAQDNADSKKTIQGIKNQAAETVAALQEQKKTIIAQMRQESEALKQKLAIIKEELAREIEAMNKQSEQNKARIQTQGEVDRARDQGEHDLATQQRASEHAKRMQALSDQIDQTVKAIEHEIAERGSQIDLITTEFAKKVQYGQVQTEQELLDMKAKCQQILAGMEETHKKKMDGMAAQKEEIERTYDEKIPALIGRLKPKTKEDLEKPEFRALLESKMNEEGLSPSKKAFYAACIKHGEQQQAKKAEMAAQQAAQQRAQANPENGIEQQGRGE